MRHGDHHAVGQSVEVVVDFLLVDVLGHLATPHEIDRHDVRAGEQVMQGDRIHRALHIDQQAVDAVGNHTQCVEEPHGVTFAASDVQHGPHAEAADKVAPQRRVIGPRVAMPDVAAKIWPCRVEHRGRLVGHDCSPRVAG